MAEASLELEFYNVKISARSNKDLQAVLIAMAVAYYDAASEAKRRGHRATAKSYTRWATNLGNAADELEEDEDDILDGDLEDIMDELLGGN